MEASDGWMYSSLEALSSRCPIPTKTGIKRR